jgi:hypothetical protein
MTARRNGSGPQDAAPDTAEVESGTLSEIADRLRMYASEHGLPSRQVEEALAYAGLTTTEEPTPEPTPEPGPEEGVDVNSALDLLSTAVQALRSALAGR